MICSTHCSRDLRTLSSYESEVVRRIDGGYHLVVQRLIQSFILGYYLCGYWTQAKLYIAA
jgi:hypothetical protein